MFVGRQKELKVLNDRYQSEQFEMVVIYGRRRIGKTALINRFIENKKALYFVGVETVRNKTSKICHVSFLILMTQ